MINQFKVNKWNILEVVNHWLQSITGLLQKLPLVFQLGTQSFAQLRAPWEGEVLRYKFQNKKIDRSYRAISSICVHDMMRMAFDYISIFNPGTFQVKVQRLSTIDPGANIRNLRSQLVHDLAKGVHVMGGGLDLKKKKKRKEAGLSRVANFLLVCFPFFSFFLLTPLVFSFLFFLFLFTFFSLLSLLIRFLPLVLSRSPVPSFLLGGLLFLAFLFFLTFFAFLFWLFLFRVLPPAKSSWNIWYWKCINITKHIQHTCQTHTLAPTTYLAILLAWIIAFRNFWWTMPCRVFSFLALRFLWWLRVRIIACIHGWREQRAIFGSLTLWIPHQI